MNWNPPRPDAGAARPAAIGAGAIQAKLAVPRLDARSVRREFVADLAERARDAKLVLFRAPSGFGKTTAMRQYYEELGKQARGLAWLTLDPLDDDFRRLLLHLVAAFDRALPPEAAGNGEAPNRAAASADQLAFVLVDRIERAGHPFTVFIDDLESVSNRAIDELLRLILDRLPPHGQLAIASREMPGLQVGRLRAHGELVEVGQLQLRFNRTETEVFLQDRQDLSLSQGDMVRLHDITEGWPVALWLARVALANRPSPHLLIDTFSGSDTVVAEYLSQEVLARLPDHLQQFLLRTSLLSEMTPGLCDAVCRRQDSDEVLRTLEQSNGFVALVDPERRLYRYHGLFTSFLRSQSHRLGTDEVPELHRLAADWFRAAGRPVRAIEHALEGGDYETALTLLSEHSDRLLFDGRFRLLAQWLGHLPEGLLRSRLSLRVTQIWALMFTGNAMEALRKLDSLENQAARDGLPFPEESRQELAALRPMILCILDRHEEGYWLAEEALRLNWSKESFPYNLLATVIATWRVAAGRYVEATDMLSHVAPSGDAKGASFAVVYAICIEGLVQTLHGRIREAIAQFRVAFNEAAAGFGSRSVGKSIVAVYLAEALYEVDELSEAEQVLALYLPITREYAMPDNLIIAHVIVARIAFDRGDADHAFRRLSELEYLGRQSQQPRVLAAAQLERARIALLRDDVAEAQLHLRRAKDPEAWAGLRGLIMFSNDIETVELGRYRLAARGIDKEESLAALKADLRAAQSQHRNRRALKLKMLMACTLQACGQNKQALRSMQEALETACPDGLLRPFIDEGGPVIDMVREVRIARLAAGDQDRNGALLEFIERILRRAGVRVDQTPLKNMPIETSVTLTDKEVRVLESVALGMSNIDIAESIFVTETTVRAHLRKINVKLGTSNRTQAVAVARRLGLIR